MFHKFPKIQNIESLTAREWQEFKSSRNFYIITEKIDGSNASITLDLRENAPDKIQIYTRNGNQFSSELTDLFIQEFAKLRNFLLEAKYDDQIYHLINALLQGCNEVNIAGEFFGSWVMNRIDYGTNADFNAFSMTFYYKDDRDPIRITPIDVEKIFNEAEVNLKVIPHSMLLTYLNANEHTFDDECKFGIPSQRANKEPKKIERTFLEGYVIYSVETPIDTSKLVLTLKNMVKIKDPNFKDVASVKNEQKSDEIQELNGKLNEMISENRLLDTISKFGGSLEPKQFGEFIKFIIQDAQADFAKEYEQKINKVMKSLEKRIYKVSSESINKITKFAKEHTKK